MHTNFQRIRLTRKYLVVEFTIKGQVVAHRHVVRVPWRALNRLYRPLLEHLEDEAQLRLNEHRQGELFPLEKWE